MFTALFNLLMGDYTPTVRHITGLEEDHPVIAAILSITAR